MAETTQAVEPKPVPAPVAEAAGLAVEDLLDRWRTAEPEASNEVVEEAVVETTGEPGDAEAGSSVDAAETENGSDSGDVAVPVADKPAADVDGGGKDRALDKPAAEVTPPPVIPAPELDEITRLIDADDFDPFDVDAQKKVMKTLVEAVKAQKSIIDTYQQATQATAYDQAWKDYATKNPDVGDNGRKLWEESIDKLSKRGLTGDSLRAAAEVEWEHRLEQYKSAAKARAAKPAPTPSPKGTSVTPRSSVSARPPQPKPKTIDDKLIAGEYGNLANVLGS